MIIANGPVSIADHVLEDAYKSHLVPVRLFSRKMFILDFLAIIPVGHVFCVFDEKSVLGIRLYLLFAVDVGDVQQPHTVTHHGKKIIDLVNQVFFEQKFFVCISNIATAYQFQFLKWRKNWRRGVFEINK